MFLRGKWTGALQNSFSTTVIIVIISSSQTSFFQYSHIVHISRWETLPVLSEDTAFSKTKLYKIFLAIDISLKNGSFTSFYFKSIISYALSTKLVCYVTGVNKEIQLYRELFSDGWQTSNLHNCRRCCDVCLAMGLLISLSTIQVTINWIYNLLYYTDKIVLETICFVFQTNSDIQRCNILYNDGNLDFIYHI